MHIELIRNQSDLKLLDIVHVYVRKTGPAADVHLEIMTSKANLDSTARKVFRSNGLECNVSTEKKETWS